MGRGPGGPPPKTFKRCENHHFEGTITLQDGEILSRQISSHRSAMFALLMASALLLAISVLLALLQWLDNSYYQHPSWIWGTISGVGVFITMLASIPLVKEWGMYRRLQDELLRQSELELQFCQLSRVQIDFIRAATLAGIACKDVAHMMDLIMDTNWSQVGAYLDRLGLAPYLDTEKFMEGLEYEFGHFRMSEQLIHLAYNRLRDMNVSYLRRREPAAA